MLNLLLFLMLQLSSTFSKKSENIRILMLSDIHMSSPGCKSNMGKVVESLNENGHILEYDYVFVSGDMTNLPNKLGKTIPP